MVDTNEAAEFKTALDRLVDAYLEHVESKGIFVDMTDFAVWILIKQGHDRGFEKGFKQGVDRAVQTINKLMPDAAEVEEPEKPDDAQTVAMPKVEWGHSG